MTWSMERLAHIITGTKVMMAVVIRFKMVPLFGWIGDLTDGVIPTENWHVVEVLLVRGPTLAGQKSY